MGEVVREPGQEELIEIIQGNRLLTRAHLDLEEYLPPPPPSRVLIHT